MAVFGFKVFGCKAERYVSKQGQIEMKRGGEVFPADGPAVARCHTGHHYHWEDKRVQLPRRPECEVPHHSPNPDCTCGIYGYHNVRGPYGRGQEHYTYYWCVYLVKGWGNYIWGEEGQWRAEFVRPVGLSFDADEGHKRHREFADRISSFYQIPVMLHEDIPLFMLSRGWTFDDPAELEVRSE